MAGAHDAGIRFLTAGGRRVAYHVTGAGPALVAPAWWVSHLELDWQDAAFRGFWQAVAEGHTLVRYDHLGVGMSERDLTGLEPSLELEVATLAAVLDTLGLERVSLFGGSTGGATAVAFAARQPERVERLLLYGAYLDGAAIAPREVRDSIVAAVRAHWGLGSRVLADLFLGEADAAQRRRFERFQRQATDAATAARLLELVYRADVRELAPGVTAPTLVAHRRADRAVPYRLGVELAAAIPGAALAPLEGGAHFPWAGDWAAVVRALRPLRASGGDRTAVTDAGPLSARELEVLALLAVGLRDAEIAERLVVSPHTVHRHVANIRHKLGSRSRAAAVAEAARLGLLPGG